MSSKLRAQIWCPLRWQRIRRRMKQWCSARTANKAWKHFSWMGTWLRPTSTGILSSHMLHDPFVSYVWGISKPARKCVIIYITIPTNAFSFILHKCQNCLRKNFKRRKWKLQVIQRPCVIKAAPNCIHPYPQYGCRDLSWRWCAVVRLECATTVEWKHCKWSEKKRIGNHFAQSSHPRAIVSLSLFNHFLVIV